jgi:subtilisin family serine protease
MKKIYAILLAFLFIGCMPDVMEETLLSIPSNLDAELVTKSDSDTLSYYWCFGEKIYLPVSHDDYFAIFNQSVLEDINELSPLSLGVDLMDYNRLSPGGIQQFLWAKVDASMVQAFADKIEYVAPYLVGQGSEVGVTDTFYIKLKSENDYGLLVDFAANYDVEIVKENFLPLWYALVCTDQSTENALTLSNLAYESGYFDKTDINLMGNFSWNTFDQPYNDPRFVDQWNLYDTYGIGIEQAHSITFGGSSVIVAVIDSGIRLNHPDLPVYTSWDAVTGTAPGQLHYTYSGIIHTHGTETSGVIGAYTNNNTGIVGVAPGVTLLPISIGASPEMACISTAIRYAVDSGAKVISNSYSYNFPNEVLHDAFKYAIDNNCTMVQSSGNINCEQPMYPYSYIPEVISVGCIGRDGTRWEVDSDTGSTHGTYLDVVAPGVDILTTSVNEDYVFRTGTSLACPHVAAVAGLMLSVNRMLTPKQVSDIIESTARKLPTYSFSTFANRPNGTWSSEVGYGLIDPASALISSIKHLYSNLIEFNYCGQEISFSIKANKDITIIWDWDTLDITEVSVQSPTTYEFHHTFSSAAPRHICIAENIGSSAQDASSASSALVEFDFTTANHASNIDIKPINASLKYVRIIGGFNFIAQEVNIKNLPNLEELYLVRLKDSHVSVVNCPSLRVFGTSTHVWIPPMNSSLSMNDSVDSGSLDPNVVVGGNVGLPTNSWPDVPEKIISPMSLHISGCNAINILSLENVGFGNFSFTGLPCLAYVYLSSQHTRIVGAGGNALLPEVAGSYLCSAISSLPYRTIANKGMIVVRAVSNANAYYIPVSIYQSNKSRIYQLCDAKNWDIVWESGID